MPAATFVVRGRVQGVGFRWFVREAARRLDLGGSVRNAPDGSVEVTASGPADALDRLEAALHAGPPGARVDTVSRAAAEPSAAAPLPFTVLR